MLSLAAVLDSKLFLKTVFSRELPEYAATLVKMQIHGLNDMSSELESPRLLPFQQGPVVFLKHL